jgi:hypothetical protein
MIERMFDHMPLASTSAGGGAGVVERLRDRAGSLARAHAEFLAAVWDVVAAVSDGDEVDEFAADEVRAALSLTRRAADALVDLAWQVRVRLPAVWHALRAGDIDVPRARVIVDGVTHLDDATARLAVEEILKGAGERTTGQLRARLRRLVIEIDPAGESERYRQGVEGRRVIVDANTDGTANLCGWDLPADRALSAMAHVDRLARAAGTAGDDRTIDQRRVDVFLDLLEGRAVDDGRVVRHGGVDIRVGLETLVGRSEEPGEIPGWGPVIADVARRVADANTSGRWRYSVVGDDNHVLATGVTRRRPLADQRRHVESQDPTCVFPGCRMPASQSDLDHTRSWAAGGATVTDNLAPLCRHDHRLKHEGGWQLSRGPAGTHIWTSRLGRTYETRPQAP